MLRALFSELRHLALDHARVHAVAARRNDLLLHLPQQRGTPALPAGARQPGTFGQAAAEDPQAARERQTVRVEARLPGRTGSRWVFCSSKTSSTSQRSW